MIPIMLRTPNEQQCLSGLGNTIVYTKMDIYLFIVRLQQLDLSNGMHNVDTERDDIVL